MRSVPNQTFLPISSTFFPIGGRTKPSSRRIAGTPWTLVYQIDRAEALGDSDARLSRLTIGLVLVVAVFAAALVAVLLVRTRPEVERAHVAEMVA